MIWAFNTFLAEPIYNLLIGIYAVVPGQDIGIAIILLTIIIKLILWPLAAKSIKGQQALQKLQPKLAEIKEQYKDDKEGQSKAMMKLYADEKVSPLSSCLPLLVQLPIILALYRVFLHGLNDDATYRLYSFIPDPDIISPLFFGVVDLSNPNIFLAIGAGIFQFFQAKMMNLRKPPKEVAGSKGAKDEAMLSSMNRSMVYFMPIITVVIGASLPGGLTLYWMVVNIISVIQQYIFFRKIKQEEANTTDTKEPSVS
ncbi:YidC/Oxa1 family membrane protein insertase [Patescibacteria group bacterium]|nr:YidC/Oxa1 family membrane protein insertase [Patescibacteria group bacterium]